jgi:hypothetical protein
MLRILEFVTCICVDVSNEGMDFFILIHLEAVGKVHHLLIEVDRAVAKFFRLLDDSQTAIFRRANYSINFFLRHRWIRVIQLFHHHSEGDTLRRVYEFAPFFYL